MDVSKPLLVYSQTEWDDAGKHSGSACVAPCTPFSVHLHTGFSEALAIPKGRWMETTGDLMPYQWFAERRELRAQTSVCSNLQSMASLRRFGQVVDSRQNVSSGVPQSICKSTASKFSTETPLLSCKEAADARRRSGNLRALASWLHTVIRRSALFSGRTIS